MPASPYSLPISFPDEPDEYQGAGNIDFAPDGQSVTLSWECSLIDTFQTLNYLIQLPSARRRLRRSQMFLLISGGILTLPLPYALYAITRAEPGMIPSLPKFLGMLFLGLFGLFLLTSGLRYGASIREGLWKSCLEWHKGREFIDLTVTIAPDGVTSRSEILTSTLLWQNVTDICISDYGVIFQSQEGGVNQLPFRLFSDAATVERCITLAKKHLQPVPDRMDQKGSSDSS